MIKKLILLFLLLVSFTASAEPSLKIPPLKEGSILPSISLDNQHGELVKISPKVEVLLYSAEKAPSKMMNRFLKDHPHFLADQKAVFVANISAMPSLISKFLAIPKMKKYTYDVLLIKQEDSLTYMPYMKDHLSILKMANGKITSISYVNNKTQLMSAFN